MTCNEMEAEMLRLKDVPCMDCIAEGRDGIWPICAMQFDHVPERGTKVGTVRSCIKFGNEDGFRAEIAKCDIICANHHEIRTQKRGKSVESIERMSQAQKKAQKDPAVKAKKSALISASVDERYRKRSSQTMTANWARPGFRENIQEKHRQRKLKRQMKLLRSFDRKAWMEMVLNTRSQQ